MTTKRNAYNAHMHRRIQWSTEKIALPGEGVRSFAERCLHAEMVV